MQRIKTLCESSASSVSIIEVLVCGRKMTFEMYTDLSLIDAVMIIYIVCVCCVSLNGEDIRMGMFMLLPDVLSISNYKTE